MVISLNNPVSAKFLGECSRTKVLFPRGFLSCQAINISATFHPFKCEPCHCRQMISHPPVAEFEAFPGQVVVTWWVTAMGAWAFVFSHRELAQRRVPKLGM